MQDKYCSYEDNNISQQWAEYFRNKKPVKHETKPSPFRFQPPERSENSGICRVRRESEKEPVPERVPDPRFIKSAV